MSDNLIPLLKIPYDSPAIFKLRPNRFLGIVDIKAPGLVNDVHIHIHDPGRLTDLLYNGNKVLIKHINSSTRKTQWDLIAANHQDEWILTHSGYHRAIIQQILQDERICPFGKALSLKAEVTFGHSRLDFLFSAPDGERTWIEVKGCTLAIDRVALFPDAPTKRGTKHLQTLIDIKKSGQNAVIIVLVFRPESVSFAPHKEIDPAFAGKFDEAIESGVQVIPMLLMYRENIIYYIKELPVSTS